MSHPLINPAVDAHVRAAWQEQVAAAGNTPGLAPALLRQRQEVLPRFAVCYTQLRALPRRVRRSLQRQWKHSLAGVALLLALGQEPAMAATIPVSATCSLVNAIRAANNNVATGGCPAGSGADTITLPVGSTRTLTAVNNTTFGPTGLPVVSSKITIEGNDSTIRRGSSAPDFRILAVGDTGDLTLKETTITGGVAPLGFVSGGGIFISYYGVVTLEGSTISGNSAFAGGGIENAGRLTITDSTISGNTATKDGGGVRNIGLLTITDSTISGNSAPAGGGVYIYGATTIENSTISGNAAFGGGGVWSYAHPLTITHSTISGNTARNGFGGGGVANFGTVTIQNSTISGNSAINSPGGGVGNSNNGTLRITDSTISGNAAATSGGGVSISYGTLTLAHTLVSGNTAPAGPEINSSYPVTANAFNLFGHDGNAGVSGFMPGASDVVPAVPLSAILAPTLAANGGPTLTHALVPGSPALDAVMTGCPPPTTDQRGLPRLQGPRCDIGAVEATFCGGRVVTLLGTPGNNTLTGTAGRDVIAGLGGNDTLIGLGGNDVLCGGEGNDILRGGAGVDWLFGGNGQDQLRGEAGNDQLRGEAGGDALDGGANTDVCDGGPPVTGDTFVNCETAVNRLASPEEVDSEGEEELEAE